MSKDAYFFPHDCNARHDPKILKMRSAYKLEGLGLYWALVEMMREQEGYLLPIDEGSIQAYALDLNCTPRLLTQYITDCSTKFELFHSDDHCLWSDSLIRRMSKYDEKSEQAREAALTRWGKDVQPQSGSNAGALHPQSERIKGEKTSEDIENTDSNNADAMQAHSGRNASKVEYNRVNKSKVNKIIEMPDFIDKELWDDFMEMRTKKRIPNTDRAKLLLVNALTDFKKDGFDVNKIIEQSIMRGWTGVFPFKNNFGVQNGANRGSNQKDGQPQESAGQDSSKYTGGKYGHMVRH